MRFVKFLSLVFVVIFLVFLGFMDKIHACYTQQDVMDANMVAVQYAPLLKGGTQASINRYYCSCLRKLNAFMELNYEKFCKKGGCAYYVGVIPMLRNISSENYFDKIKSAIGLYEYLICCNGIKAY